MPLLLSDMPVRPNVAYVPRRHEPPAVKMASALPLILQSSDGVECHTNAGPAPRPLPGAIEPTEICIGSPVTNVVAQPITLATCEQLSPMASRSLRNCPPSGLS